MTQEQIEKEIEKRLDTPDNQWDSIFNSGFSRGFSQGALAHQLGVAQAGGGAENGRTVDYCQKSSGSILQE